MTIILILAPFALLLGVAFLFAFIWATRDGQFDDLDTPPLRMLLEDKTDEHH